MKLHVSIPAHKHPERGLFLVGLGDTVYDDHFVVRIDTDQTVVELRLDVDAAEAIGEVIRTGRWALERRQMEATIARTKNGLDQIRAHGAPLTREEKLKLGAREAVEELQRISREIEEGEGGYVTREDDDR